MKDDSETKRVQLRDHRCENPKRFSDVVKHKDGSIELQTQGSGIRKIGARDLITQLIEAFPETREYALAVR